MTDDAPAVTGLRPGQPAHSGRALRWAMVVFFLLVPLQWVGLGSSPLGATRLHQVAVLGVAVVILLIHRARAYSPVVRTAAPFIVVTIYMLLGWAAIDLYNGRLPTDPVQEFLYLGAFVAFGTAFYRAASGSVPGLLRTLRWAGPLAVLAFVVCFGLAMAVHGVNPGVALNRSIAAGDPELFQEEVFKASFPGVGLSEDFIRGNLRHEIFGSLLLSVLISTWASRFGPRTTVWQHRAIRTATIVLVVLLAVSMSRAVLIAAAVWPLLSMLRALRRGTFSGRQLTVVTMAALGLAVAMAAGLAQVIWVRFTSDTTGYEARAGNYDDAFDAISQVWLTGGYETAAASSHNFVFDSFLRGGIFVGVPALAILVVLIVRFFRMVLALPRLPDWMIPVTAALALPVVRMLTAGGGMIPPVQWVALAFVFGVLAYARAAPPWIDQAPPPEPDGRLPAPRRPVLA